MDFFLLWKALCIWYFSILVMVLCIFEHFELISIFAISISLLCTVSNFFFALYYLAPPPWFISGSATGGPPPCTARPHSSAPVWAWLGLRREEMVGPTAWQIQGSNKIHKANISGRFIRVLCTLNMLIWHRINEKRDDKSFIRVERVSWMKLFYTV